MTKVKLDMANMNDNLNKVADAITKMNEDNNARDRKFEELMKGFTLDCKNRTKRWTKSSKGWRRRLK